MTAAESPASGYRDRNSTAERALTILEMFGEDRLAISAVDVAGELAVARSTAYRYLESLVASGFLEESPGGGFRLGLKVLELARLARRGYGLSEVALPWMRRLSTEFGQTVLLTRRAGASVVCLEREISPRQLVRLSYERGSQLPLTAGASALVLLAWLPEDEARALLESAERPRFTDRTLVGVDELMERLLQIRSVGYTVSHAEVDPHAHGMAAPIFDARGAVTAGLSVVALEGSLGAAEQVRIVAALRSAANEISNTLALATA